MLVTNRRDSTADWLVTELERRGAGFFRFDTEHYPAASTLRLTPARGTLVVGERALEAEDVTGVWWRRPLPPARRDDVPVEEAAWAASEARTAIEGFWRMVDARWVNWPDANMAADCKPEQLARARRIGFAVPDSLVTNDPEALRAFAASSGPLVCKSLRFARIPSEQGGRDFYTSALSEPGLEGLGDLGPEPYLFQTLVPKRYDVRVTVIGDDAWACRIESQAEPRAEVDWRRHEGTLPHAVEQLPSDVAGRCVELTHSYGLRFSAIDLVRDPHGDYWFLELNVNGQWAWVEQLTGLPLRARLADELLGRTT